MLVIKASKEFERTVRTFISKGSSSDLEIVFFEKGTSELIKSRGFVSLLLSVIKDASSNPHDAYQAARCLRYLVTISATKEAVSKILLKKMKAEDFIGDNGEFFAKCHHDGLFLESKRLIEELNKNISSETNKNLAC
jgi:hypothetical protein